MKKNTKTLLFYVVLIIGAVLLSTLLMQNMETKAVKYSDVIAAFTEEKVMHNNPFKEKKKHSFDTVLWASFGGSHKYCSFYQRGIRCM